MSQVRTRQNEKQMLRIQYAARHCFNRAEKLNILIWAFCILAELTIFLPSSMPDKVELGIPVLIDLAALLSSWKMVKNVSLGASFRKYFDAYVLGFGLGSFSRSEEQNLLKTALKIEQKHPETAKTQMTNTGRDKPPGVKDWYELSDIFSPEDEAYECQRMNCEWNNRLAKERLLKSVGLICVLVAVTVLLHWATNTDIWKTLLCCSALLIRCGERIGANTKYILISYEIDSVLKNLSDSRTEDNVKKLQDLLDTRREMPVLEKNRIHKRRAKSYSEEIQNINEISRR